MKTLLLFFSLVNFSLTFAVENRKLELVGEGEYTFFFMSVYHAKMWASNSSDLYNGDVKLELKYNMNFEGKDIVKQTLKEFISAGIDDELAKTWTNKLLPIFPDVTKGDRIVANYTKNDRINFYLNDKKKLGTIKGHDFSKAFLNIWLGPNSSDQDLRNRLIGMEN